MTSFEERYQYVLTAINLAYMKADMDEAKKWKRYRRELVKKEAPENLKAFLLEGWGEEKESTELLSSDGKDSSLNTV